MTKKVDHPALYPPGCHQVSVAELMARSAPAQSTPRRQWLWQNLCGFITHLQGVGLAGMPLWLDGSFITTKADPDDIDAVLWVTESHARHCPPDQYRELEALKNRPAVKLRYRVDLYIGRAGDAIEEANWRSRFGTCHDGTTPKGLVCLIL